jgi:hypothetical protein
LPAATVRARPLGFGAVLNNLSISTI